MEPTWPERHPNLGREIGDQMERSAIEGGARLERLPVGGVLEVTTENTDYRIERVAEGESGYPFRLSGHPRLCPEPVRAGISGSSYGGALLRRGFIGRGMQMEFHLEGGGWYTTTPISRVEEAATTGGEKPGPESGGDVDETAATAAAPAAEREGAEERRCGTCAAWAAHGSGAREAVCLVLNHRDDGGGTPVAQVRSNTMTGAGSRRAGEIEIVTPRDFGCTLHVRPGERDALI